jgi:DNA-binding protein HU-beta
MTKSELIPQVAQEAQIHKDDAKKIVDAFSQIISETLKSRGRLALAGFGTLVLTERKARQGRHPQTGKTITIPGSRIVKI